MQDSRQERYRRRTLFKAVWFGTLDEQRKHRIRQDIAEIRRSGPVAPEQEALFPYFLSHPLARNVVLLEQQDRAWIGFAGSRFDAALALVAFRSISSAPARFRFLRFLTNSGSGAVCESDPLFGEIVATAREMKSLGLWVAE